MATYNGWTVQVMPTDPAAPAGFEFQHHPIVAVRENPFTGQQQIHDWQQSYMEASVSMPLMPFAQAQAWLTFLRVLQGTACVFQFPSNVVQQFPIELTTDGTNARWWRLKQQSPPHWKIQLGSIYSVIFEIREAI